jgi:hypothetical protein
MRVQRSSGKGATMAMSVYTDRPTGKQGGFHRGPEPGNQISRAEPDPGPETSLNTPPRPALLGPGPSPELGSQISLSGPDSGPN